MLKLVLTRPMAKNESTVTCLMVNEVHSVHPGLNGAASFPSLLYEMLQWVYILKMMVC